MKMAPNPINPIQSSSESGPHQYGLESNASNKAELLDNGQEEQGEINDLILSSTRDVPECILIEQQQEQQHLVESLKENFAQQEHFVRKILHFMREKCERLAADPYPQQDDVQSPIKAIFSLRKRLLDFCKYLMSDRNPKAWSLLEETIVGTESALALVKQLSNERPMGLDLLLHVRNIIIDDGPPSNPDAASSGSRPAGNTEPINKRFPRKQRMVKDKPHCKAKKPFLDGVHRRDLVRNPFALRPPPPLELLKNFDRELADPVRLLVPPPPLRLKRNRSITKICSPEMASADQIQVIENSSNGEAVPASAPAPNANHTIAENSPPLPKYLLGDNSFPSSITSEAEHERESGRELAKCLRVRNHVSSTPLDLSIGRPLPPLLPLNSNSSEMSSSDEVQDIDD